MTRPICHPQLIENHPLSVRLHPEVQKSWDRLMDRVMVGDCCAFVFVNSTFFLPFSPPQLTFSMQAECKFQAL